MGLICSGLKCFPQSYFGKQAGSTQQSPPFKKEGDSVVDTIGWRLLSRYNRGGGGRLLTRSNRHNGTILELRGCRTSSRRDFKPKRKVRDFKPKIFSLSHDSGII